MRAHRVRASTLCLLIVLVVAGTVGAASGRTSGSPSTRTNVTVLAGAATPSVVTANSTVPRQRVSVYVAGVSADGVPDTHYLAFPNALVSNGSLRGVTVNGGVAVSSDLVDGFDDDGVVDTVAVRTNATGGGTTALAIQVNASVTYPSRARRYTVDARTVDGTGATATERGIATITATNPDSSRRRNASGRPVITDFRLNASRQDVDVLVTSTQDLETLKVKVKGKVKNVTLTRADFTETTRSSKPDSRFVYDQDVNVYLTNTSTGDVGKLKVKSKVKKIDFADAVAPSQRQQYVYRADVSEGQDGTFEAQLVRASSDGRNASDGHRDELTVHAGRRLGSDVVFAGGAVFGGLVVLIAAFLYGRLA